MLFQICGSSLNPVMPRRSCSKWILQSRRHRIGARSSCLPVKMKCGPYGASENAAVGNGGMQRVVRLGPDQYQYHFSVSAQLLAVQNALAHKHGKRTAVVHTLHMSKRYISPARASFDGRRWRRVASRGECCAGLRSYRCPVLRARRRRSWCAVCSKWR